MQPIVKFHSSKTITWLIMLQGKAVSKPLYTIEAWNRESLKVITGLRWFKMVFKKHFCYFSVFAQHESNLKWISIHSFNKYILHNYHTYRHYSKSKKKKKKKNKKTVTKAIRSFSLWTPYVSAENNKKNIL